MRRRIDTTVGERLEGQRTKSIRLTVAARDVPQECDHEWRIPPDWQSGYCIKCGKSSTQR